MQQKQHNRNDGKCSLVVQSVDSYMPEGASFLSALYLQFLRNVYKLNRTLRINRFNLITADFLPP